MRTLILSLMSINAFATSMVCTTTASNSSEKAVVIVHEQDDDLKTVDLRGSRYICGGITAMGIDEEQFRRCTNSKNEEVYLIEEGASYAVELKDRTLYLCN